MGNSSLKLRHLLFSITLISLILHTNGANILALFPSVWKSHYIFGKSILQNLVQQNENHTVTIVSPYGDGERQHERIEEIRVEGLLQNWEEMGMSFDLEAMRTKSSMERFTTLIYAGTSNVDKLIDDTKIHDLLRNNKHFDLIVVDLFLSDALLGFSFYYNAPTIVISPTGSNTWLSHLVGNPESSALDPSYFLPFTEEMNVWERCVNTLMGTFEKLTYNFFLMISQQTIYERHFQPLAELSNATLPHHRDLAKNLSLVILNSNAVLQYPKAYLPNMLQVAGAHLVPQKDLSLPQHLNAFIESASQGTVYISFGANAKITSWSSEKLNLMLDIFATFTEMNFLLKWEEDNSNIVHFAKNLMISNWFPQQAILAHPNVTLFISSCGLMSVVEAINHATPILAIPILSEQVATAKRLEKHGVSLILQQEEITYDAIFYSMQQLINTTVYKENMRTLREHLFYDNPSPIEKSIHYIEMVLKMNGSRFLKSHANNFNFLRLELLDVLAIIILGMSCVIAVPFMITSCILRKSYTQATMKNSETNTVQMKNLGRSNSYAYPEETTKTLKTSPIKTAMSTASLLESLELLRERHEIQAVNKIIPNDIFYKNLSDCENR